MRTKGEILTRRPGMAAHHHYMLNVLVHTSPFLALLLLVFVALNQSHRARLDR